MKTILAVSAVAFFAASTATFAADVIRPAPVPTVPVVDSSSVWDGFYAGFNAGYGWGEIEATDGFGGTASENMNGFLAGAQIGYNHNFGGFIAGVEADYQWSGVRYSQELVPSFAELDAGISSFGTVRARIGADMDQFMPYVTGGFAFGEGFADLTLIGAGLTGGDITVGTSEWHTGWTVGAGVEFAATDDITVKAEYLYADFGEQDYLGGAFSARANLHVVRGGVNFQF